MSRCESLPSDKIFVSPTSSDHEKCYDVSTSKVPQHDIYGFKEDFLENDSASPISRCSSGSSLSTTLSSFSSYSLPAFLPSAPIGDIISSCYYKLNSGSQGKNLPAPTKTREIILVKIKILSGILIANLLGFTILFLGSTTFFFLNVTSILFALFLYTSYRYVNVLQKENSKFLLHCLPSKIQTCLSETSIHQYMLDQRNNSETKQQNDSLYKYMLIYFIPGLSENDLMRLIEQLPLHHQALLLQPGGIAKMLLPESILNLLAPPLSKYDNINGQSNNVIENSIHENVTIQDAVNSLIDTTFQLFPQSRNKFTKHCDDDVSTSVENENSASQESLSSWDQVTRDDKYTRTVQRYVEPPLRSISMNSCKEMSKENDKSVEKQKDFSSPLITSDSKDPEENMDSFVLNTFSLVLSNYIYNAAYSLTKWANNAVEYYSPLFIYGGLGLSGIASAGVLGWSKQTDFMSTNIEGILSFGEQSQNAIMGYGLVSTALYGTSSAFFAWMFRYVSRQCHYSLRDFSTVLKDSKENKKHWK